MENVFGILGWIVCGLFFLFALFAFTGAPYVPTLRNEAEKVFKKLYRLGRKDLVVDLGSGDGTVLVAAAKCGAKVYGIELNPILVLISRFRLRKFKHARVDLGNIFNCKFPAETTVVYLFGEDRDIMKFAKKIRDESARLKKPLFVISQGFEIPGLVAQKTERAFFLYKIDANSRFEWVAYTQLRQTGREHIPHQWQRGNGYRYIPP